MMRLLSDLPVAGKTVLCRVDYNVPMEHGRISDYARIERTLPTIRYLTERGAKVVALSHLGRPKGEFNREFTLAPLADALEKLLRRRVAFSVDCVGHNAQDAVKALEPGQILLLENLRFHKGEEKNAPEFADALASLGDVFVNESFSCSHRAHASITGLAERLPSAAGFLMQEETEALVRLLSKPEGPVVAIVGGSKISTKLSLLGRLVDRCAAIAVGGAMANTFLKADGMDVKRSLFEPDFLDAARFIMAEAQAKGCRLVLPVDAVTAKSLKEGVPCDVRHVDALEEEDAMFDLGPRSVAAIDAELFRARTLIWNGPLGALEVRPFDHATVAVARTAAALTLEGKLISVAGGGDVISGLNKAGHRHAFTYVSTAGGAFLEWLEDPRLPGIVALGG